MKKQGKRLWSILLCLVVLSALMTVTAFAAEEIEELTLSFMTPSEIPAVGEPIKHMSGSRLTEEDDRIELTGNILLWCIDDSSTIINKTYDDTGMYYEAGRTYNSEIVVEVLDPEQYTIGENTKITLTNPGDFTYTSEISSISAIGSSFFAHMKLTITMNGERTYPDIIKVVFQDLVSPAEGMSVTESSTDIHYSNCQMTSSIWLGNVWGKDQFDNNTFVAGETYTYRVVLTARDGYKFYDNATIQLTSGGVAKAPSYYAYTNDNRTLTLDYTYTVPSVTWVEGIEAAITRYEFNLTPMAGNNCVLFDNTLEVDENAPYQVVGELGRTWYSEDGTELTSNDRFEAGKTYYFDYAYSIKDEYRHLYRFVPENLTTTITGESYTGEGFQKAERVEYSNSDNTFVKLRYYFTAQFPDDVGENANNPAWCYSYIELKTALESSNIRYVALGNVEDMLPVIPHDEEKEPEDITRTAILVRGTKDLNLLGDAVFSCPLTGNYDLKYYIQLLTLTDAANSNLYIHGDGSLTYAGGTLNFVNSVIKMEGGHLTVDGATIRGSNGYHTGFCYGINAVFGSVSIQGGATVIGEIYGGEGGISALTLGSEGVTRSLSVSIFDGKFYIERDEGNSDEDHGIAVNNDIGLRIYGGSFDGIDLGRYAADTLADYVMDGCTMTVNGVKTDPASCGTTNGFVEVYQEISKVDIHVNSPVAGKSPAMYPEDVYMVPDGCTAMAPVWYEDNSPWNISTGSERFEAGSTYKVELTLVAGEGVKFANPLTSATINYQNAEVSAFAGNAEKGVTLTVDFGACPSVVPQVDLTVTAPKEGNTPSYSIGCGSNAYYPVGGSNNYTEYRQWYMSSDNDDWWEINGNHNFMSGYYYKFVVDIQTKSGYEFPLVDVGTIQPDVTATVNGYSANVIKAYEQDPSRYITVEYNFGECSDSVVNNIIVENVTPPVAGEKPNYTYSVRGTGYQMNTAKNAYEDIYWKNPPEKWYYIKNGIGWFDMTDWGWVYENETFIAGHEYQVGVYLKTEDGYEFAHSKWYEPTVTATVNGYTATPFTTGSDCTWSQQVQYTFTCGKQELSTVMLYDLEEPVVGKVPDPQVIPAYPEYYTVQSVTWTDIEGGAVGATFEAGVPYQVRIVVKASAQAYFTADPTVYIDGTQLGSRNVTVAGDTLTIEYAFSKPAAAPEVEKAPIFNWSNNKCTIYANGSGATMAAAYQDGRMTEAVVFGNQASVTLSGDTVKVFFLKDGSYAPIREAMER